MVAQFGGQTPGGSPSSVPHRIVRRPPSYYEFLASKYAQMQQQKIQGRPHPETSDNTTSSSCSSSPRSVDESSPPEIIYPQMSHGRYLRKVVRLLLFFFPFFMSLKFLRFLLSQQKKGFYRLPQSRPLFF